MDIGDGDSDGEEEEEDGDDDGDDGDGGDGGDDGVMVMTAIMANAYISFLYAWLCCKRFTSAH